MPRENRKRGKKHKQKQEQHEPHKNVLETHPPQEEPTWIVSESSSRAANAHDPEAPFGFLDVDIKAYFRTVDLQIRDWQENREENIGEEDVDPNEKKNIFFTAALNEMRGKEKQFATDPECSIILERMLHSMDDFVRRVFFDSLAGSYGILIRHRFASHVCQTLFTVAKDTINREKKGVVVDIPHSPEKGELRTLTQLVLDICEELIPDIASAVTHPYASHVIRSLLLLLSPNVADSEDAQSSVRSKKSVSWKAKQGQMKSVFDEGKGKGMPTSLESCPQELHNMARRLLQAVRDETDENEIRAMAANKVACPMLKVLLEIEADQNLSNESGSLMDNVAVGIISACQSNSIDDVTESDYLGTLIRDTNGSHVLETLVNRCPADAFDVIWRTYFEGKLPRLAVHPVANYVVAKTFERVSLSQLEGALQELDGTWSKLIQKARTGVMRAAVDRAATLKATGLSSLPQAVLAAFGIKDASKHLVPCILTINSLAEYEKALANQTTEELPSIIQRGKNKRDDASRALEPKIQGSLLLQSLLKLPEPLNQFIIDSILELTVDERIRIAHDANGSRIFDVFFDSPTVSSKMKRRLVVDFIGHYYKLVENKFGSRIGDRCWAFTDTYLKEKIARSLIAQEQEFAASFFGKFFFRKLNIHLLQRKPDVWRNLQSERRNTQESPVPNGTTAVEPVTPSTTPPDNRKRKNRNEDEIDILFSQKLGKKVKKAALSSVTPPAKAEQVQMKDKDLEQVLGSLRSVERSPSRKKKSQ